MGITLCAIFTASLTSALTAESQAAQDMRGLAVSIGTQAIIQYPLSPHVCILLSRVCLYMLVCLEGVYLVLFDPHQTGCYF